MNDTPSTTFRVALELPAAALRVEAPRPVMVSQFTAEAILGLRRRQYLELAAQYRGSGGEVLCAGRTRLVALDAFLTWLRRRQATEASPERDGVAEVADAVGWRLAAEGGS